MKKYFVVMLMACLLTAGLISRVLARNVVVKEVMNTTFNAVTTSDTTDDLSILGYDNVAFFVDYDETEVGNNVWATISADLTVSGTASYVDAEFSDFEGDAQISQELTNDGTYYFWFKPDDICAPYARIEVLATNTDADDLLNIKIYMTAQE